MSETPGTAEQQQPVEAEVEGCPVKMYRGGRCGRPLYNAPAGVDEEPVCLMHSRDPEKDNVAFQQEIERILGAAGEGEADFTYFVFPRADYAEREFKARCIFRVATFTQDAAFIGATFTQRADFGWATFTQEAYFHGATFTRVADFFKATFTRVADFSRVTFTLEADFSNATFTQEASFFEATFTKRADFYEATFTKRADFTEATFTQWANFIGARFTQPADFGFAKFTQAADFSGATFTQEANFIGARFTQRAHFRGATLEKEADFRWATFSDEATFWKTTFRNDGDEVGPVFSQARFEKPERVVFYGTYLGQVLFHNCDVSKFVFSNVEWRRRENGKRMVFEEVVSLEHIAAEALKPGEGSADERNYSLIAELYQQLKKNFDDRRDYWTAGDFHWGEMEMKRLSSRRHNRVLRWLKQTLGLTALYKHASEYGESYRRPLELLIAVLLLFTVAYPLAGLERAGGESGSVLSWAKMGQFFVGRNYAWWSIPEFWLHGLLMAASVMVLQRELPYSLVSSLGWWLRLAEYLLSLILIPLFLLALRRQFRR